MDDRDGVLCGQQAGEGEAEGLSEGGGGCKGKLLHQCKEETEPCVCTSSGNVTCAQRSRHIRKYPRNACKIFQESRNIRKSLDIIEC